MSRHTPGPWTVTRVSKSTILKDLYVSASPERIARVVVPSTARDIREYEANARLIAAAPELMAAITKLEQDLRELGFGTDDPIPGDALVDLMNEHYPVLLSIVEEMK